MNDLIYTQFIHCRYAKIPDEPVHVGVPHIDKGSSSSGSESGSESESESDGSDEERNNKVKLLEKELHALQEKMRKLVEESNTKKKAKKKTKDKSSNKKPNAVPNAVPKANTIAAYAAKANTIAESLGKLSEFFDVVFVTYSIVDTFIWHGFHCYTGSAGIRAVESVVNRTMTA